MRNVIGIVIGTGVLLSATTVFAQPEPPPPPPPAQPPPPLPPPPATATATATVTTPVVAAEKKDEGPTDHEKVVGHFGVMYFGITSMPIGTVNNSNTPSLAGFTQGSIQTPVIGARYWLKESMGVDLGLGFGFANSGNSSKNGPTEVSNDGPASFSFAVHGGVPFALAYGKHYKFLLVPEATFGYASRGIKQQNVTPPAVPNGDVHLSGYRLDIGARVGTEIQFGFIGVPQLALQASVGLAFRRQLWHGSQDAGAQNPQETSVSTSTNDLSTTVQNDPWALFVNNISAIYYFP